MCTSRNILTFSLLVACFDQHNTNRWHEHMNEHSMCVVVESLSMCAVSSPTFCSARDKTHGIQRVGNCLTQKELETTTLCVNLPHSVVHSKTSADYYAAINTHASCAEFQKTKPEKLTSELRSVSCVRHGAVYHGIFVFVFRFSYRVRHGYPT